MMDRQTLLELRKAFEVSLGAVIGAGVEVSKLSSEDYQKGFLQGADVIKQVVLGTLERVANEEVE